MSTDTLGTVKTCSCDTRTGAPPPVECPLHPPSLDIALTRTSRLEWLLQSVLEVQQLVTEDNFDLDHFMERVVDVAEHLTSAKGAVIELVDGDEMVYRSASTSMRAHIGLRLQRAHSLSGLCVAEQRVLRCEDSETDPRVDREACRKVGVRSMLCTPLFQSGRAVGVLKVMASEPNAFGSDDQYLLSLLGGALGAALGKQLMLQELKSSEEIFRTALEMAPIGNALVTPDGHFLKVNAALCTLLGYSEAELLATNIQAITHPEDLLQELTLLAQTLAGELQSYQLEKRYEHRSGRIIWALLSVALVRDRNGKPRYFITQIQDISERREVERVKGDLISMVSHELRTPLTSIRGSLGLLAGTSAERMPPQASRLLTIANNNCERLIHLIDDILDVDKIASGNMRFDMRPHALADLLDRAVQSNEPYAQRFNVRFVLERCASDVCVTVDDDRLLQVLSNLLSNAAKFSPANSPVHITSSVGSSGVRVNVIDRGPGIPEEFRARIFGKFTQADSSSARRVNGTGLGLHISKQMIERMDGSIGFDTQVGAGTVFWIDLPTCAPQTSS